MPDEQRGGLAVEVVLVDGGLREAAAGVPGDVLVAHEVGAPGHVGRGEAEGRAAHRGTLRLRYRERKLGLRALLRGAITAERTFYEETEAIVAPPFVSLDAAIHKSLGDYLNLTVGVNNIADVGDAIVLPIRPRTFYAGLTGTYELDD